MKITKYKDGNIRLTLEKSDYGINGLDYDDLLNEMEMYDLYFRFSVYDSENNQDYGTFIIDYQNLNIFNNWFFYDCFTNLKQVFDTLFKNGNSIVIYHNTDNEFVQSIIHYIYKD